MLYMVVEKFRNGDPVPVYGRFREHGRLAPEGLTYLSSWVDEKLERCFQLMETDDRRTCSMSGWNTGPTWSSLSYTPSFHRPRRPSG